MRLSLRILTALACVIFASSGRAALQDALVARDALTDVVASCVVRIDYDTAPAVRPAVFATVFRLEDGLWLYAPETGTRSLGLATGTWPDSASLSARLQGLDPGIRRVTVYANPVAPIVRQEQLYLNNACVIASLHSLTRVLETCDRVTEAGLILMAFDSNDSSSDDALPVNHCVLAYRRDGQWWGLDPNQAQQPFPLKSIAVGAPLDPALAALALQQRYPLKSAHLIALSPLTFDRIATNVRWRSLAAIK